MARCVRSAVRGEGRGDEFRVMWDICAGRYQDTNEEY